MEKLATQQALVWLLLCFCPWACAANGADLPTWPELKLVNGMEYHDAKVIAVEAGGIKIMHAAGVARVPETLLPPDIRAQFTFDPARVAIEEAERLAKDQAARERVAAIMKAQRHKEAETAARERLKYGYRTYLIAYAVNGGFLAYKHDMGGVVGEVGQVIRRMFDDPKRLRFSMQPLHVQGGTNYDAPVWLEARGEFAEGDLVGGFVAEFGTVEIGNRVLRRIVLEPGRALARRK